MSEAAAQMERGEAAAFPTFEDLRDSDWRGGDAQHWIIVQIKRSAAHPGHHDYRITFVKEHSEVESVKPVKTEFVEQFIRHALPRDVELRWIGYERRKISPEALAQTLAMARAVDEKLRNQPRVYFMVAGPFVKIGYSIDPYARRDELQTGCPYAIEVAATMRGDHQLEARLHQQFCAFRARDDGEWFHLDGALAEYVRGLR